MKQADRYNDMYVYIYLYIYTLRSSIGHSVNMSIISTCIFILYIHIHTYQESLSLSIYIYIYIDADGQVNDTADQPIYLHIQFPRSTGQYTRRRLPFYLAICGCISIYLSLFNPSISLSIFNLSTCNLSTCDLSLFNLVICACGVEQKRGVPYVSLCSTEREKRRFLRESLQRKNRR